jgi:hypothetical protein
MQRLFSIPSFRPIPLLRPYAKRLAQLFDFSANPEGMEYKTK